MEGEKRPSMSMYLILFAIVLGYCCVRVCECVILLHGRFFTHGIDRAPRNEKECV